MMLHRLAASTSSGVVGSMTQLSAPTDSATASPSFALGPPFAPSPSTDPWYLDYGASFHMTHHSAHFLLCVLITSALFILQMVPLFLLLDRACFVLTLFMSLMFPLFSI
jgi:hypothetical protein